MTWAKIDYQFMSRAIQLAKRGRYTCHPNPRVGCVISRDDRVLGEGWHAYAGQAHAEINAIKAAGDITGSRVYLTLEPCSHHGRTPPCVDALIAAGIEEAVIAMSDPNPRVAGEGIQRLQAAGIRVRQGLLETEARKLNPGFCKRMEQGLPVVRCKMAMSLDARTALANGLSQWISSAEARRDVHRLRALSTAIMTSVDTVISDDPSLTVRDIDVEHRQPLRIIVDRQLKTPASARILALDGKTVIYTEVEEASTLQGDRVDVVYLASSPNWLEQVFKHLAKHYEINDVMVEAGSTFAAALLAAGLLDELVIYMAPKILGSDAQPLMNINGIQKLDDCYQLTLADVRQVGPDLRLTYRYAN